MFKKWTQAAGGVAPKNELDETLLRCEWYWDLYRGLHNIGTSCKNINILILSADIC